MVQLIKIERLGPRIEGMLYRRIFDETWALLDEASFTGSLNIRYHKFDLHLFSECEETL